MAGGEGRISLYIYIKQFNVHISKKYTKTHQHNNKIKKKIHAHTYKNNNEIRRSRMDGFDGQLSGCCNSIGYILYFSLYNHNGHIVTQNRSYINCHHRTYVVYVYVACDVSTYNTHIPVANYHILNN